VLCAAYNHHVCRLQSSQVLASAWAAASALEDRLVQLQTAQQDRLTAHGQSTAQLSKGLQQRLTYWERCVEKLEASSAKIQVGLWMTRNRGPATRLHLEHAQDGVRGVTVALSRQTHAAAGCGELEAAVAQLADHLARTEQRLRDVTREAAALRAATDAAAAQHDDELVRARAGYEEQLQEQARRLQGRLAEVEAEIAGLRETSHAEREAADRTLTSRKRDAQEQARAPSVDNEARTLPSRKLTCARAD